MIIRTNIRRGWRLSFQITYDFDACNYKFSAEGYGTLNYTKGEMIDCTNSDDKSPAKKACFKSYDQKYSIPVIVDERPSTNLPKPYPIILIKPGNENEIYAAIEECRNIKCNDQPHFSKLATWDYYSYTSSVKIGASINYTCVHDHSRRTSKCQGDGTWSPINPHCPNSKNTYVYI